MEKLKSFLKVNKNKIIPLLAAVVVFLSYLIYICYKTKHNSCNNFAWFSDIFSKFAMIFVTISVTELLWKSLGGKDLDNTVSTINETIAEQQKLLNEQNSMLLSIKLLEKSRNSGLIDFYDQKNYLINRAREEFLCAKENAFLMGYYLSGWIGAGNFSQNIANLANKKIKVCIMIMDENNDRLASFANENLPNCSSEDAKNGISAFVDEFKKIDALLNEDAIKPQLVKVFKGLIASHLCVIDSCIYATPYFFNLKSEPSPTYVVSGRETILYTTYMNEFKELWNKNFDPSKGQTKL